MNRIFVFAVGALMVCSMALADDQPAAGGQGGMTQGGMSQAQTAAGTMGGEQQKAIQDQVHRIDESLIGGKAESVTDHFSPTFTMIRPQGTRTTRDQWMQDLKSGALKYTALKRESDQVRVYGNTAVETGTINIQGQENGKDISGNYGYTHVWVKQPDGRWMAVAAQFTPLSGEPSQAGYQEGPRDSGNMDHKDMDHKDAGHKDMDDHD